MFALPHTESGKLRIANPPYSLRCTQKEETMVKNQIVLTALSAHGNSGI